jgi:hypothetical protein
MKGSPAEIALRSYELRFSDKAGAIDDLLAEEGAAVLERIVPRRWWFDRLHDQRGAVLRIHYRPATPVTEGEEAEHLLLLDRLTLTAASRGTTAFLSYLPRPPSLAKEHGEARAAGAVPAEAQAPAGLGASEGAEEALEALLEAYSGFALEVIREEQDCGSPLRKDCMPTLVEYLLKYFAAPGEAGAILKTSVNNWVAAGGLARPHLELIAAAAADKVRLGAVTAARRRFISDHAPLADRFFRMMDEAVGTLSHHRLLATRRQRTEVFTLSAQTLLNQLGFQYADLIYIGALLRKMGY